MPQCARKSGSVEEWTFLVLVQFCLSLQQEVNSPRVTRVVFSIIKYSTASYVRGFVFQSVHV